MDLSGHSEPKFDRLKDAFQSNFTSRGEIGAAIALQIDGQQVVSLWSGYKDSTAKTYWTEDTLTNVYSTTKGIAATTIAILVSDGRLRYEDKVATHWPEFAAHEKGDITIAMLMSHQSGLSGFREPVSIVDIYDSRAAAARLAAMEPLWIPGSGFGYHPLTIGFLVDELCYRVSGQGIRELVEQRLNPLCYNGIFIGCPEHEQHRAATLYAPTDFDSTAALDQELDELQLMSLANPVLAPELPNTSEWRAAVIASANGFASAKGLSSLYGGLAALDLSDSRLPITPRVLEECCLPQVNGSDKTLALETRWGCGFLINSLGVYGPSDNAFGHSGWGGSFAFADPDKRIGFAYVMNQMGTDLINDPRNVALVESLYACL